MRETEAALTLLATAARSLALSLCVAASTEAASSRTRVNFDEAQIEGEIQKPNSSFVMERAKTKFPCDISELTLSEYNACFDRYLADRCGVSVIERERYELKKFAVTAVQGGRTVAGVYPYSVHLEDGSVYLQEASQFDATWGDRVPVLRNQTPKIGSIDWFVAGGSYVLAERKSRRIFVIDPRNFFENEERFRRIDLASPSHSLIGVTSGQKLLVSTPKDILLMSLNARSGIRVRVPWDEYFLDPQVDRSGNMLIVSATRPNAYIVSAKGHIVSSFQKENGYTYYLLPNGLLASANRANGSIKIRTPEGVVLSRTSIGKPLVQFGLFRHEKSVDLFYVTAEGLGVLYPDGFEKSFLTREGVALRVVQSSGEVLALLVSTPSHEDPKILRERTVEYFSLGKSPSRISRVVEGICPGSLRAAERALDLKPSLKATVVDGRAERAE
jgi:hypothetical protein